MMADALPVAIGICSRGTLAKRARSVVVRIEANPKPYVGYDLHVSEKYLRYAQSKA